MPRGVRQPSVGQELIWMRGEVARVSKINVGRDLDPSSFGDESGISLVVG